MMVNQYVARIGRLARALGRRREALPEYRVLFACSGGTSGWPGMGRSLYATERVFRESIESAGTVIGAMLGWDAAAAFRGNEDPPDTREIERRNALVHAGMIQFALVDLWREHGITAGGALGVSLGEIASPYAVGARSRDDCARALAVLAEAICPYWTDVRIFDLRRTPDEAEALCRTAPVPLGYLASTSPGLSAVVGLESDADALRAHLAHALEREQTTDWYFHTSRAEIDRARITEQLRDLSWSPHVAPIYSATTGGRLASDACMDAEFIAWMLVHPTLLTEAASAALLDGFDLVLSIGARPHLRGAIARTASARERPVRFVDSMLVQDDLGAWTRARKEIRPLTRARLKAVAPISARTLDLAAPEVTSRLADVSEELRIQGPVHFLDRHGFYIALGYDAVRDALARPDLFSSRFAALQQVDWVLLGADPPEHTDVRRLLTAHFSAGAVARRTQLAVSAMEGLLQPLLEGREIDVVRDLAGPLVQVVAADLLGISQQAAAHLASQTPKDSGELRVLYAALESPIADILHESGLYHELRADDALDEAAARSLIRLLWIAGTATPQQIVTLAVFSLLRDDGLRTSIQNDEQLVARFVDEVIRLNPPRRIVRCTTQEAMLDGVTIPSNCVVQLWLPAANRDPSRFPEPATIRLDRSFTKHLSFGGGAHRCIGAALARAEAMTALEVLLRMAPNVRSAQPLSTVRCSNGAETDVIDKLLVAIPNPHPQ